MMATITEKLETILAVKEQIKSAIEDKGVTVGDSPFNIYPNKILEISSGGNTIQEAEDNDVIFYDYDGFKVASYSITEAKELRELPTPPEHNGLTFQGWNWTLNDIQTYNRRFIDVGAIYTPTDGKTHIKVHIVDPSFDFFSFAIRVSGRMKIQVNYGDGQTYTMDRSSTASAGNYVLDHTYSQPGDYDITFTILVNTNNADYWIYRSNVYNYKNHIIKELNIGNNMSLDYSNSLMYFQGKLTIPSNISSFGGSCFSASNIPQINIPRQNIDYPNYCFYRVGGNISFPKTCTSWTTLNPIYQNYCKRIVLPEPATTQTISNTTIANGIILDIVSIPSNVTIGHSSIIGGCGRLRGLDIVQGFVPNMSLTLDGNNTLDPAYLIDFFTKLGTTTNAITLTIGSANLDRLTADQKAIATNKGYTLA